MKKWIPVLILFGALLACADSESKTSEAIVNPTEAQLAAATPLKNALCPVTKASNGTMGAPQQVIYKGQIVYLCCAGCKAAFAKDPEKYLLAALESANQHH